MWGADMNKDTTPLEAGLDFFLKHKSAKKGDFIGKDALLREAEEGLKRKLVMLEIDVDDCMYDYFQYSPSCCNIMSLPTSVGNQKSLPTTVTHTQHSGRSSVVHRPLSRSWRFTCQYICTNCCRLLAI